MRKFIYRMDDICPEMNWDNFYLHLELFSKYNIVPLLGIVPDNRDEKLTVNKYNSEFWGIIKNLKDTNKIEIAQHGMHHTYHAINSSYLGNLYGIPRKSEFVGLAESEQYDLIKNGKEILASKGLDTSVFMAPSHTFDENTISALCKLGFTHITDGKGLYPYKEKDITFVSVQFGSPKEFPIGIITICIHSNAATGKSFGALEKHVKKFAPFAVRFSEAGNYIPNQLEKTASSTFSCAYGLVRVFKNYVRVKK